jgi:hypothetical protein
MFIYGACCGLFAIACLLAGGSVIFRTAVILANRILGVSPTPELYHEYERLDEWIGYRQIKRPILGIPEPAFSKGMLSILVLVLIDILAGIAVRTVFGVGPFEDYRSGGPSVFMCHMVGLMLCYPLGAWVLSSILPSSFRRACLVLVTTYFLIVALIVGVYGIIWILD